MNIRILLLMMGMLAPFSSLAAEVSDGVGLAFELEDDGRISSVSLHGRPLPVGNGGGFYLCEPNRETTPVSLVGKVVAKGGKVHVNGESSLKARVRAEFVPGDGYIEVQGELEDLTGKDRGLWLGFNLPVDTVGWKWGRTLSTHPVVSNDEPGYPDFNNLVPIPSVWNESGGIALAIPPTHPCVFEVRADGDGLRIQMAYGLSRATTKFPSKARFCFRIYSIDGEWGYRDALAKYYDWYSEFYTIEPWIMKALDHHHDWIGMNYVNSEFKTEHLINPDKKQFMAYTKTSARIQNLDGLRDIETRNDFQEAIGRAITIQHYEKNGGKSSSLIREGREALLNSACYDPDGNFAVFKMGKGEIDFPHNCDPELFADKGVPNYGSMYLEKAEDICDDLGFVSIHWDRLGGWGTALNYRKEHFAYLDHPLTFDQEGRVCAHVKFTNYELFDAYREQSKRIGLFHEAAGMKVYGWNKKPNKPAGQERDGRFFTAALVAGGWQEGSFKPIGLGGFDFERVVVGRKSYRISSGNIVAHKDAPTIEAVKNALAKTTAYGFACPVQIQYFYKPGHPGYLEEYSGIKKPEHRDLWNRYEPANLAIRLAGWEPVTHAWSSSDAVQLQRFGKGDEIYLTVWGPEPPETVDVEIDAAALGLMNMPVFSEMVSDVELKVTKTSIGWKLAVPMEKNMTRVIRIGSVNR